MAFRHWHLNLWLLFLAGCTPQQLPWQPSANPGVAAVAGVVAENPLYVPVSDREFVWNQIVDTVDDYFQIEREERVRLIGGVATEGRIDTVPLTGATLLEPWRRDSTHGYEKLHATLQSIRRRAVVRVIPDGGGYLIDLAVFKEVEDVDRAEHSTIGASTLRYDSSLVRNQRGPEDRPLTLGWISLGRDTSLEQQMLSDLSGRLAVAPPTRTLPPIDAVHLP